MSNGKKLKRAHRRNGKGLSLKAFARRHAADSESKQHVRATVWLASKKRGRR